ncbi:ABC transporter permease [Mesorhizobium sp. B2-6-1]|nr:ABC transporter permease [Mesorhizobium sp. B2-6-1]
MSHKTPDVSAQRRKPRGLVRRLLSNPLSAIGAALVLIVVLIAVLAPLIAPFDPIVMAPQNRLLPPSAVNWFGTDDSGRDIFSRIVFGTRYSLLAALGILVIASALGTVIGLAAGLFGGWVDEALMRLTDMFLAFPALVLAMGMAAALGPSLFNAMIATVLVWWPWYARLVRGQTLQLKQEAFVEASIVAGASRWRIAFHHILRNCLTPLIVQISLDIGYAVLTLAGLSFIGLGAQPPTPEWGSMVSVGRDYFLDQWWMVTFPGMAIFVSVMAFNLLGDGLQEVLSPRSRR